MKCLKYFPFFAWFPFRFLPENFIYLHEFPSFAHCALISFQKEAVLDPDRSLSLVLSLLRFASHTHPENMAGPALSVWLYARLCRRWCPCCKCFRTGCFCRFFSSASEIVWICGHVLCCCICCVCCCWLGFWVYAARSFYILPNTTTHTCSRIGVPPFCRRLLSVEIFQRTEIFICQLSWRYVEKVANAQ